MDEDLQKHLERVKAQLDEILGLLRPVSAHATWVDSLRDKLERMKILPRQIEQ